LRALNIPARYATGYLGDIGVPRSAAPMDFSAWMEVYLGGHWYTMDARHNAYRIGRVLQARRARDAVDCSADDELRGRAICRSSRVWTEEVRVRSLVHVPGKEGHFSRDKGTKGQRDKVN